MAKRPNNKPTLGIALSEGQLDLAVLEPKHGQITRAARLPLPPEGLDNPEQLKQVLQQGLSQVNAKGIKSVGVSVPTTLLRQLEMPRLNDSDLYTALSSEAERYQSFQGVEAVADFARMPALPNQAPGTERIVYGGLRKDRLQGWLGVFQSLKLQVNRLDIHINHMLRALASSGVLDAVVQQAGEAAYWGILFRGNQNVWFALWQANQLMELREVNMDLGAMASEDELTKIILENDIYDEIRRTAQHYQPVAVWLTDGLEPGLMASLSEKLGVPVQPCELGPIVSDQVEIVCHPAAIGAAFSRDVDFPFGMNFSRLTGASKLSDKKLASDDGGGADPSGALGGVKLGPLLLMLGAGVCALALLFTVGLWVYTNVMVAPKARDLTAQVQQQEAEQSRLKAEEAALQRQYDTRASLADLIHRVIQKNRVFPALMGHLHTVTPTNIWVYKLDVGNQLRIEGKGLSDTAIIKFAKQFDPLAYTEQMAVHTIEEEFVNDEAIYKFELRGATRPGALTPDPGHTVVQAPMPDDADSSEALTTKEGAA